MSGFLGTVYRQRLRYRIGAINGSVSVEQRDEQVNVRLWEKIWYGREPFYLM